MDGVRRTLQSFSDGNVSSAHRTFRVKMVCLMDIFTSLLAAKIPG